MFKRTLFSVILLLAQLMAFAQGGQVKGIVKDSNGEPVIGATITEAGNSRNATVTNYEGNFTLKLSPKGRQIVISYIGMKTKTLRVTAGKPINVTLEEDATTLSEVEVVAVGYGQARRRDLTGSISSVGEKTLKNIQTTNAASAITGRVAGVNVVTTQGSPDADVTIRVRGGGSITQNNEPLYIIDGFQAGSISDIPVTDIESIDVLKDASSTAIYGAKGANGVVLVTTKSGRAGKTEVTFNASMGLNNFYNETEVLSPYEYVYLQRELDNTDKASFFDRYGRWEDIDIYKSYQGTDWQKKLFDRTGVKQTYNVNINGGTKDLIYSLSYTRDDESYIMEGSKFKRDALNTKISKKFSDKLRLDFNAKMTYRIIDGPSVSYGNKLRDCVKYPPVKTLIDLGIDDLGGDDLSYENISYLQDPFYNIANEYKKQKNFNNSYNLALTWDITKWLQWRTEGTYGFSYNRQDNIFLANTGEANGRSGMPVAKRQYQEGKNWTFRTMLNFKKNFGKHHTDAMIGFEGNNSESDRMNIEADYFPLDYTVDNILAMWNNGTSEPTYTTINEPGRTLSYFGRANYVYGGKYYFTFTLRADGTNVFSPGNKWGVFPAVAAAWRITDEKFMAGTRDWLDNLKLRLSHGVSGNARVGSYWRQTYSPVTAVRNLYFQNETGQSSLQPSTVLRNDKLTWETKHSTNVGIDFTILKKKLDVSVDWYNDVTKDLIMSVQLPSNSGYNTQYQNLGQTTNRGIEFTVNANIIDTKDFYLGANFNISFNKNTIHGLDGDQYATTLWYGADNVFIQRNGCPIGAIFGYVEDGFYDTEAEVMADPKLGAGGTAKIGEIKYRDMNNDGIINENDRVIIGDTNPNFVYGITNNIRWRDLSLSFMFQGSQGNDIFNGNLQDIHLGNIGNITRDAYNTRWTADNYENARWPMASGGYERNFLISDRYVEDASYLRLKNITLSYNWRRPIKSIENIQFSFGATNVFTITNYSWFDPDVNAFGSDSSRRGVDIYSYPISRTYTFGINFTF